MDFTSLRLWQWMIVGTLAGAAVGFAWTNLPNDLESRRTNEAQFRRLVGNAAGAAARNQEPMIRNIVVYEPQRDPSNVLVYPVTFEFAQRPRNNLRQALAEAARAGANKANAAPVSASEPTFVQSGLYATTPFDGQDSIIDFLKKRNVDFKDRSGAGQYVPVYYGAAGGFVGIGLLWPAMIQGLIKLKLVPTPPPREKKVKAKHRTGEDVDDMLLKPVAKPVDGAALDNLNNAMEASLAANLTSGGPRTAQATSEEPVSVLMSGTGSRSASDPTEAPAPMTEQEQKDFSAGQYYPVARVTKKPTDAP